ncbi:hypothetical protein [Bradyrhizobium sp. Cp5.3]|uniref:hypothetical protein n=1 Tax=Bradyrhizobium sp. Cp5.3 TaxID=443598 RepID=UPI000400232F|nr:hypothetical protein [Bradyrhizobium sp. Cp5.3]
MRVPLIMSKIEVNHAGKAAKFGLDLARLDKDARKMSAMMAVLAARWFGAFVTANGGGGGAVNPATGYGGQGGAEASNGDFNTRGMVALLALELAPTQPVALALPA